MSNKLLLFAAFIFLSAFPSGAYAQCCAAGSPAGTGTTAGMVPAGTLRISSMLRFTRSSGYFSKDSRLENPLLVKKSDFIFQGITLSYGIFKKLTAEADLGYFYLKDQLYINNAYLGNSGLSNGNLMLKTKLFHSDSLRTEISAGAGLKFPFNTRPVYKNGVKLPADIQPSTQAFGIAGQLFARSAIIPYRLWLYLYDRFEYNFKNQDLYRYGSRNRLALMAEYRTGKQFAIITQIRHEYADMDYDYRRNRVFSHSGSHLLIISPMLVFSTRSAWHLTITGDYPVYKYYTGTQLSTSWSAALSVTHDFSFRKIITNN